MPPNRLFQNYYFHIEFTEPRNDGNLKRFIKNHGGIAHRDPFSKDITHILIGTFGSPRQVYDVSNDIGKRCDTTTEWRAENYICYFGRIEDQKKEVLRKPTRILVLKEWVQECLNHGCIVDSRPYEVYGVHNISASVQPGLPSTSTTSSYPHALPASTSQKVPSCYQPRSIEHPTSETLASAFNGPEHEQRIGNQAKATPSRLSAAQASWSIDKSAPETPAFLARRAQAPPAVVPYDSSLGVYSDLPQDRSQRKPTRDTGRPLYSQTLTEHNGPRTGAAAPTGPSSNLPRRASIPAPAETTNRSPEGHLGSLRATTTHAARIDAPEHIDGDAEQHSEQNLDTGALLIVDRARPPSGPRLLAKRSRQTNNAREEGTDHPAPSDRVQRLAGGHHDRLSSIPIPRRKEMPVHVKVEREDAPNTNSPSHGQSRMSGERARHDTLPLKRNRTPPSTPIPVARAMTGLPPRSPRMERSPEASILQTDLTAENRSADLPPLRHPATLKLGRSDESILNKRKAHPVDASTKVRVIEKPSTSTSGDRSIHHFPPAESFGQSKRPLQTHYDPIDQRIASSSASQAGATLKPRGIPSGVVPHAALESDTESFFVPFGIQMTFHVLCPGPLRRKLELLIVGIGGGVVTTLDHATYLILDNDPGGISADTSDLTMTAWEHTTGRNTRMAVSYRWIDVCTDMGRPVDPRSFRITFGARSDSPPPPTGNNIGIPRASEVVTTRDVEPEIIVIEDDDDADLIDFGSDVESEHYDEPMGNVGDPEVAQSRSDGVGRGHQARRSEEEADEVSASEDESIHDPARKRGRPRQAVSKSTGRAPFLKDSVPEDDMEDYEYLRDAIRRWLGRKEGVGGVRALCRRLDEKRPARMTYKSFWGQYRLCFAKDIPEIPYHPAPRLSG